ncbi:MAG: SLC13 family permease [Phycisphaerae bacterium]|nr:SLC13 family permease [Phycisphaerae bacterium]
MGWDAWLTVATIGVVLGTLILTRIPPDVVFMGGLTVLLAAGALSPSEALAGLSNEGMVTVGVMYVIVTGLKHTGGIAWIVSSVLGRPKSVIDAQRRLLPPVVAMSAFLNNTPVVAMLIPAVTDWAKKYHLSVSKLMIPLSYAAIFGGTCTLIGTSTNLVVNGLMKGHALPGLAMFDIAWVGFPCALAGLTYLMIFGRWLLPERLPAMSRLQDPREYTVEMIVEPNSPVDGRTIEQAGLRHLTGMYLAEIERDGNLLVAVSPQERLRGGDRLVFVGVVSSVVELQRIRGLQPATNQVFKLDTPRDKRCLIEAVVSNSCRLVGQTIRDGQFRKVYNAVVIAVARNGERIRKKVGDIILRPGDTLLLETLPSFTEQQRDSRDFYLVSRVEDSNPPRHDRMFVALGILSVMVTAVALQWINILPAAMLAAGLMIITRCCTASAARASVDWQVLLVIAAAFGMGRAIETSGLAGVVATELASVAGDNPWLTLAVIYGVTMLFTELITNNGAAVLIFPIALATSERLGVSFTPFAISIMMAASASFSTPIGYQTNLMVYGPGGYRFGDYFRVGIPLNLLMWAITVLIAPLIWPFRLAASV